MRNHFPINIWKSTEVYYLYHCLVYGICTMSCECFFMYLSMNFNTVIFWCNFNVSCFRGEEKYSVLITLIKLSIVNVVFWNLWQRISNALIMSFSSNDNLLLISCNCLSTLRLFLCLWFLTISLSLTINSIL